MKREECRPELLIRIDNQIRSDQGFKQPPETMTPLLPVIHKITPSTDEQNLNKTERAYLGYLRSLNPMWLGIQCIKLKLADNTTYTPDFWTISNGGVLHALEVKGFWRDDARVKIKVAARQYPWARFTAASKTKHGWTHEEIKP